jgi:hypothetical protein
VDADGYGSSASGTTVACSAPGGYVSNNSDCNDGNASINPGRTEVCNGVDDNCDGAVDNGITCVTGACGLADGGSTLTAPTSSLCAAGNPTVVSGAGPWTWTCQGIGGLPSASCSSNRSCASTPQYWSTCEDTPSTGVHGAAASVSDTLQPSVGSASLVCSQGTWTVQPGATCINLNDTCPTEWGGGITYWFNRVPQQGSDGNWYCYYEETTTEYGTCEDDRRSVFTITGPARDCWSRRVSGQCCDAPTYICSEECWGDLCVGPSITDCQVP